MGFLLQLPDRDYRGLHDAALAGRSAVTTMRLGMAQRSDGAQRAWEQANLCQDAKVKDEMVVDRLEGKERDRSTRITPGELYKDLTTLDCDRN